MESLIDEKKLKKFYQYLDSASLTDKEKNDIRFLILFLQGKAKQELSSRTFLFYGEPGIGKTFLVEKILSLTKKISIIYVGCAKISHKDIIKCKTLEEAYERLEKTPECIIFIDDLRYVADFDEDEIEDYERKSLMKILEHAKRAEGRTIFLSTLNTLLLDEAIHDRIEIRVEMGLPSEENRLKFLQKNYSSYIRKKEIEYLNRQMIGYNYRDIPELVKIAYREGKGRITEKSIKTALKTHTPSSMIMDRLIKGIDLSFKDAVGMAAVKQELKSLIRMVKEPELAKRLNMKRCNILVFHGPQGTGKSYMAKVLAGELGYALLDLGAFYLYRRGIMEGINSLIYKARRFKNCVILVDEAGRLLNMMKFAGSIREDGGPVIGELNRLLEGADDKKVEALIVMTTNNIEVFPESFLDRVITIEFKLPTYAERLSFMKVMLSKIDQTAFNVSPETIATLTDGLSFRSLEKVWRDAAKEAVLKEEKITTSHLISAINRQDKKEKPDYTG